MSDLSVIQGRIKILERISWLTKLEPNPPDKTQMFYTHYLPEYLCFIGTGSKRLTWIKHKKGDRVIDHLDKYIKHIPLANFTFQLTYAPENDILEKLPSDAATELLFHLDIL